MDDGQARVDAAARLDDASRAEARSAMASMLIEAPAGSGKTAVLTQRFLRLLRTVEDPGEILAITFTRKAAAEMRARIVRALRGEVTAPDPDAGELRALAAAALAHGAPRGWRIAEEPQTLRIQTIDAFSYWLATQLPVASRAGGVLNVTESAAELYQRAARRTLMAAETDPELAPDAQRLFERLDNHWLNLERLIAQMLEQRGHWLRFVAGEDPLTLCRRVNASLASLARARRRALEALVPESLRLRARWLPGCAALGSEAAGLAPWKQLARLLTTKDDWRRQLSAHRLGSEFAEPTVCRRLRDLIDALRALPGVREALLDLKRAPAAHLSAEDAAAIEALARVLRRAAAELHTQFAEEQRVDHTYVTGAARAALTEGGEPTDLALRTGMALRHILVDEFQDTSLAQFELLEVLTAGWEPGDGRTLFVVGDPMQSIYRFRDAEVGLFLRAREQGIGTVKLRPLRLSRNFRASPALIEFTNEVFTGIFPPQDDLRTGAVSYHASISARSGASEAAGPAPVSLELFPEDPLAEARALASRVAQLRTADARAEVAVLVVAHAHAVPVIEALEARGLPVLGVDLVPLRERMVVRDLVQLGRALYDLADRAAWLAVLRSPWCGARLSTLTALSGPNERELLIEALGNPERLGRCDPADLPRLARLREVLGGALAQRAGRPPADWLETAWMRLGASDCYRREELEDARAFFAALAERAATLEWRGPDDFGSLLERLYSAPRAGENPVQVMTIHRAKGLEFDHVLVPALDRATRGAERRLLRWIDLPGETDESELLIAPTTAVASREPGELDAYLRELFRRRDANERCRLMYVAATRARRTLWLSAAPPLAAGGTVKPDRRSPLALLWPALALRFTAPAPGPVPASAQPPTAPLRRLSADWRAAQLPAPLPLVQLPSAYLPTEPPEFSWVGETQRHIGTLVHAWLARLAHEPQLPPPESIAGVAPVVLAQLRRAGVPEREHSSALELIVDAVRRTLADGRGRWLLRATHPEARSEWELSGLSGGRLRNVVIDRSFVDEQGTRWVIDYKTSRHEGGDLEGFLAQEIERYRAQLADYASLARAVGPEPVRAALYFPLLSAFCEIEGI
jgi:ATP-dependent exoDNAse (exonuclease V) beta subunit